MEGWQIQTPYALVGVDLPPMTAGTMDKQVFIWEIFVTLQSDENEVTMISKPYVQGVVRSSKKL